MKNKNEENFVINIRRVKAGDPENQYNATGLELLWNEYNCGLFLEMNDNEVLSIHVCGCERFLTQLIQSYWETLGMSKIIHEAQREKGAMEAVDICSTFMEEVVGHLSKAMPAA